MAQCGKGLSMRDGSCKEAVIEEMGVSERAEVHLSHLASRFDGDRDAAVTTERGKVGVFTATSSALLRPVTLDGVKSGAGEGESAIEVRIWPEPMLAWVDSSERRARWLNRAIGLGALQHPQGEESRLPALTARFSLAHGRASRFSGSALLWLFARHGGDWMCRRGEGPVFARCTRGLQRWHSSIATLPLSWFGSWRLLKRMPGHVVARPAAYDLMDEAVIDIELNRPHAILGSGLRYTLELARRHSNRDRLAAWCDALNELETQRAITDAHIGAWHIAASGRLAYKAFIPSLIAESMPELPRDLLCGSSARVRAALKALGNDLPL